MGNQFQMLEDLERIIDSGYGKKEGDGDRGLEEEKKIKGQVLKLAANSLIEAGKDAKVLIADGNLEDAFTMIAGSCGMVVDKLSVASGDKSILSLGNKLMDALNGALSKVKAKKNEMLTKTKDTKMGKLYAGLTLPKGATIIGTVTRDTGETGALVRLANGQEVQYNAGVIKSLPPQRRGR